MHGTVACQDEIDTMDRVMELLRVAFRNVKPGQRLEAIIFVEPFYK
jgi:hypothetical protein